MFGKRNVTRRLDVSQGPAALGDQDESGELAIDTFCNYGFREYTPRPYLTYPNV